MKRWFYWIVCLHHQCWMHQGNHRLVSWMEPWLTLDPSKSVWKWNLSETFPPSREDIACWTWEQPLSKTFHWVVHHHQESRQVTWFGILLFKSSGLEIISSPSVMELAFLQLVPWKTFKNWPHFVSFHKLVPFSYSKNNQKNYKNNNKKSLQFLNSCGTNWNGSWCTLLSNEQTMVCGCDSTLHHVCGQFCLKFLLWFDQWHD